MDKKMYKIESMEAKGPDVKNLIGEEAVRLLNTELANGRVIFIDGNPLKVEDGTVVTEKMIESCKKEITVVNRLSGG